MENKNTNYETNNKDAIETKSGSLNKKDTHNIEIVFGIDNNKFYISKEFNKLKKIEKVFVLSNILQNIENILLYAKDIVLEQILKPNLTKEHYEEAKRNDNFYKELVAHLMDSNFLDVTKDMLTPFYYKIKVSNYPNDLNKLTDKNYWKNINVEITDSVTELNLPEEEKEINLINIITIFIILLKQYLNIFNSLTKEELKLIEEEEKAINS